MPKIRSSKGRDSIMVVNPDPDSRRGKVAYRNTVEKSYEIS
jgi:hypothetical protein